jgi:DNA-binding response OmpR family regulator
MSTKQAILIIEPDTATRVLYHRELSGAYQVFSLPDTRNALDILLSDNIRAMVIEPALASSAGWEFVAVVKQIPSTRHIPVIICSVLDERRRGQELGVSTYLVKPVLPTTLLDVLGRLRGMEEASDGESQGAVTPRRA